ncbi:MAG: hypothetical protein JNL70_20080 [Saprospiraceae bacterium]|nr:hypothetical protein [Saprospiraceae bacterium]
MANVKIVPPTHHKAPYSSNNLCAIVVKETDSFAVNFTFNGCSLNDLTPQ